MNHEGFYLIIKFQTGSASNSIIGHDPANSIEGNYYEFKFNTTNPSLLTIYTFDKRKKLSDSTHYIRFPEEENQKLYGDEITYLTNKLLVIGNYTLRDSANKTSKVSFNDGGKIIGWGEFKTYKVSTDFMTPPNNLDEITFGYGSQNSKSYAFKINADTLNLFETKGAADSVNLEIGKLKYKLVRQK